MTSLWRKETGKIVSGSEAYGEALQNMQWDIIVVGAGLAGLLSAYYLRKEGRNVLVLEADEIASGQTERTTAKITSQHGLKYRKLLKNVGLKKAKMYAQANESAIDEYERLIRDNHIACEFERIPAYLYTMKDTKALEEEAQSAAKLGISAFFTKKTELPFTVTGAVCFENQAQFQPLQFVKWIASGLKILEHTKVTAVRGHRVVTEKGIFKADKIILATHYPIRNVPGFYFLRQHQERSDVLALSGCKKLKGMYYGVDENGLSFRQSGDVLLLGGGSERTGDNEYGGVYDALREAAETYYPNYTEIAHWSAQDCMPHDGIPFIGRYSVFTPHLYVATGFQKWGMTSSMAAAMILRDMVCGRENPYRKVFCPQRMNIRGGMKDLMIDIGVSTKGLVKGAFHRPKDSVRILEPEHGDIVMAEGRRYACYLDGEGKLHKISARCPHMGCELTWNPDEKSWDCPCHGSRFDIDGKLLDNPSKYDNVNNR